MFLEGYGFGVSTKSTLPGDDPGPKSWDLGANTVPWGVIQFLGLSYGNLGSEAWEAPTPWGLVGQKILTITINSPKIKGELGEKKFLDFPHFLGQNGNSVNKGQFSPGAKKSLCP